MSVIPESPSQRRTAPIASSFWALGQALRPHQWVKNLACFAGLIFSGRLFLVELQLRAGLAFLAFSATASAVYLFNDYIDRHRDRLNPRTVGRPFASGRLPLGLAAPALLVLLAVGGAASWILGPACIIIYLSYLSLNVSYSLKLKKTVIADVMCIALGFVLRVLSGVYAVQVPPSPWIVLCMFFLALFLGFGKRRGELESHDANTEARPVLVKYAIGYLDLALASTATLTIMTYTLYCVAPHHDPTMTITVVPVVYCVLRYAHQVLVEGRGQSPERLLYRDKMLWIGILSWVVLSVAVLYGKPGWIVLLPSP